MARQIKNYSALHKLLHWLMAVMIIALFAVGFWMVDLSYYSAWYKTAPHYHKSTGVVLMLLLFLRLILLFWGGKPAPLVTHSTAVQILSKIVHGLLYLLITVIVLTGYLISTADGRGIEVYNWFILPGFGELFTEQADIAGFIHEWLAYSLMALVLLHALGALKHHFIDKDATLRRMWWAQKNTKETL